MPIVGGFVFPHGAITLDPETRDLSKQPAYRGPETKSNCISLHKAMTAQAEAVVNAKPDLILMTTPHGLRLDDTFVAHGNSESYGTAEWLKEWTEFTAEVDIDLEVTDKMVDKLKADGVVIEKLTIGAPDVQRLPMNWGEAIPLWFITRAYKSVGIALPKAVIIGVPTKYRGFPEKIPELTRVGHHLYQFIRKELGHRRVAVVTSCDLSHYHSTDPTSPYHYDTDAQPFDDLVVQWSKTDISLDHLAKSNEVLIKKAGPLTDHIGSCGYTGLVILQAILTSSVTDTDHRDVGPTLRAHLLSYSWPTYYGMLVAYFAPSSV